jgi:spore coat polysaccharide biosynthesis protein SpsF
MKIIATIQCRLGSTRLPSKLFKKINGKLVLEIMINRVKKSKLIDEIIVLTTKNTKDQKIVDFCKLNNINCFRGDEKYVFNRIKEFFFTIKDKKFKHVELFGDCPLIDYQIIDNLILLSNQNHEYEIVSNAFETTFPPGQELIIYKPESFFKLDKLMSKRTQKREHGGSNFKKFSKYFKILSIRASKKYNFPNIFLELDTLEDLKFLKNICNFFFKKRSNYFNLKKILNYCLKKPNLIKINNKVHRRWKKHRKGSIMKNVKYI